jgi:hypothetical protein
LAAGLTLGLRPIGHGSFPGSNGAWVPPGVGEIDVQAPSQGASSISLRVTDPVKLKHITTWFNGLERNPSSVKIHGRQLMCAGGYLANVTFKFRGANGDTLATANSTGGAAWPCNPIHFAVGAQPEAFLVDASQSRSLIGRVQHLLGVKFMRGPYFG